MRIIVQRVKESRVYIDTRVKSEIKNGLLVLLGIHSEDDQSDIDWLIKKIVNIRLFSDEEGNMNLSLKDKKYDVLVVSQFTLFASTKKGNRPSFVNSAKLEVAQPLYNAFVTKLESTIGKDRVYTGTFGEYMKVHLINDGPVTIFIDSRNKE